MKKISFSSTILLVVAGLCILSAIILPIWRIELDAPQYPEGLALLIYANHLGGEVDIINGLNHYIGMKTLHAEEFIEFTVLPYIFGVFGIWAILTGIWFKTKRSVLILLIAFALFGILAMVDFWKWEYDYGHNLNPTAAIQVPGMAYQPPLIGFKQLLNFGAYSIPDIGGWLMLGGGLLIGIIYFLETRKKTTKTLSLVALVLMSLTFVRCSPSGPEPIVLHKDACAHCKMNISEPHFGAELITEKGRVYKFDDIYCMAEFKKENPEKNSTRHYVHNYLGDNELIPVESASFLKGGELKSPMAGNIAAFKTSQEAQSYKTKLNATELDISSLFDNN
ncbi:MAG: nitrous oxide reductase accessory protein NosL [Saprospiraceae bacterium]|nr:nitrous oxide reductase accessory protein NosL [Saprospiraceae bacterium]MCB9308446.1 nitrous oxide reductase accessory protein NosL [Lewinellaceae bacterium]